MRILTVSQPWAWAIAAGFKSVENRARNIAGDYRGPVAIHAGLREDTGARTHPEIIRLAREQWGTTPADLFTGMWKMFGHIIGVVDLVDVHTQLGSCYRAGKPWGPCSPWAEPNAHHLVLSNPRPLREPIPYRGGLGLRRLDDDTIARIQEAIA